MNHKHYIVRQRARFRSLNGMVNLPWGTVVENRNGFLCLGDKVLCAASAQNTKHFFVQDDDGQGEIRGRLVTAILACLDPQKSPHGASSARWEKIWADRRCKTYKRSESEEHWIWTDDFYNAPTMLAVYRKHSGRKNLIDKKSQNGIINTPSCEGGRTFHIKRRLATSSQRGGDTLSRLSQGGRWR